MPGTTPPISQLDWLSSTTAMIVLPWSRATRDLLKSFGWGIAALHRLDAATKLPRPRRPPHRIFQFRARYATASKLRPIRGRYGGQRAGACSQTPGAVNPGDLMRALELYAKCPC